MRKSGLLQRIIFVAATVAAVSALLRAQDPGSGTATNVLTWQNDPGRTGQNLKETTVDYTNLNKNSFGQRCSLQLDGQVYSQPLVLQPSKINGVITPYVTYVVTQNDTLYAINGTPPTTGNTCGPVQSLSFLTTGATSGHLPADCNDIGSGCGAIAPKIGILGTPVIVLANHTATMYLVTETEKYNTVTMRNDFYHYLHSVDLPTLTENAYAQIFVPGQQADFSTFSKNHIQRPGLLYANGYIYIAFSMLDGEGPPLPNGGVFAYNSTTLAEAGYFQTSAGKNGADGGGIWQGGAGLAYGPDSATGGNYIYFNTANGVFDADSGGSDYGDSFIKLNPTPSGGQLTVAATFTPANQYFRSTKSCPNGGNQAGDWDFGSGGVMLIPPNELSTPYLAVGGDKLGGLNFTNLASPGGFAGTDTCGSAGGDMNVQTWPVNGSISTAGPVIHTNPAFWESPMTGTNYLFVAPQKTNTWNGDLLQYTLCPTGQPINSTSPCSSNYVVAKDQNGAAIGFSNGITPSISWSANNPNDAILWAIKGDESVQGSSVVGILYAFKAIEMTQLYSSSVCTGDAMLYPASKFSVPTVANGFAYVGGQGPYNTVQGNWNSGMFYIFGGLSRSC